MRLLCPLACPLSPLRPRPLSAGVCFYAMLFGRCPFGRGADNPLSLFEAIQAEDLLPLPFALAADPGALSADADAVSLLCGLLTKDPEARLSLEAALAHPFFRRSSARRPFPPLDFDSLPEYSNPEIARLEWEAGRSARQLEQQQQQVQRKAEAQAALAAELIAPVSFSDGEGDEGVSPTLAPVAPAPSKRGSIMGFILHGSATLYPPAADLSVDGMDFSAARAPKHPTRDDPAAAAGPPPQTSAWSVGRVAPASGVVVSVSESAPAAAAPGVVALEGWLYKRGRTVRSWRRRFFRLRGSRLEYWESDPRTAPVIDAAPEAASGALGGSRGAADAAASRASSSRSLGGNGSGRASFFFGSFSRSRSGSSLPAAAIDAALASSSSAPTSSSVQPPAGPPPRGSMELVAPLRVLRLDGASSRRRFRFCVATPARELQLRAECEADEGAWVAAFDALAGNARAARLSLAAVQGVDRLGGGAAGPEG